MVDTWEPRSPPDLSPPSKRCQAARSVGLRAAFPHKDDDNRYLITGETGLGDDRDLGKTYQVLPGALWTATTSST